MKSYQAFFQPECYVTKKLTIRKALQKYKHVEDKQYATKQPMDHLRNQRRNKKIPGDK